MVTNMVFNAIFAYFYGYVGLAIATALSAFVNMALLYRGLHLAGVYQLTKTTLLFSAKLLVSGVVMVAAILWQLDNMQQWLDWGFSQRALTLTGLIGLGGFVYIVSVLILGIRVKHLKAATD